MEVRDKLSETHLAIKDMRTTSGQIDDIKKRVKDLEGMEDLLQLGDTIKSQIKSIEETLYQTQNRSRQDPLNFPIRLNNKLAGLNQAGVGNTRPTDQAQAFKKEVIGKIDTSLQAWQKIINEAIPEFNELVKSKNLDAINMGNKAKITP
jgi:hypothetical protein